MHGKFNFQSQECSLHLFIMLQLATTLPSLMPAAGVPGQPSAAELVSRRRALVEDLLMATGGRGSLKLTHVMRQV